ncbi:hypothetical protein [Bradyrhizobium elkanii]|uniref:hypothetical protein n=1 Tax=Bradyrhizobium elkanii TaxID=29448 RepID=UPI00209D8CCA|nr:hypothetical protein [Bradyrhizobium elkanii]MCP1967279.1 hypothetical protein [Bradyrhizobium elkanii]MCS3523449.1 hypothetical protein [Bradyrhizobium elkanii]MCS4071104.1 hypothetical protein [Bradyrhizobium elkanii]MCS4077735.1 hypothetical protein [Bradyrhizobium elkanii]MCS4111216.1 hypothetical protein [Bradyrhizobium elkanii]
MDFNPPAGSKISVVTEGSAPVIVIPQPDNPMALLVGLLMIFLLFFGAIALIHTASMVLSGQGNVSLVIWMGLWTPGLALTACVVYRLLRRRGAVPETLTLDRDSVGYDSGLVPLLLKGRAISFPKQVHVDLDRQQLQSLRLRGNVVGQWRLTIDVGADRIDIAPNASGVEREWIACLLAKHYGLTQVRSEAAA